MILYEGKHSIVKETHLDGKICILKESNSNSSHVNNETRILQSIEHPNIVNIFKYDTSPNKSYIFLEYCKYGDLLDYTNDYNKKYDIGLSINMCKRIFIQLLDVIYYLHVVKNIVHRDLKLENILISDVDKYGIKTIKVCDFGFSKYEDEQVKNVVGTLEYLPPEIDKDKITQYDGYKADIWCLGIILYILINVEYPYQDSTELITRKMDIKTISFIIKMLNRNPLEREDISSLLEDDWLKTDKKKMKY